MPVSLVLFFKMFWLRCSPHSTYIHYSVLRKAQNARFVDMLRLVFTYEDLHSVVIVIILQIALCSCWKFQEHIIVQRNIASPKYLERRIYNDEGEKGSFHLAMARALRHSRLMTK